MLYQPERPASPIKLIGAVLSFVAMQIRGILASRRDYPSVDTLRDAELEELGLYRLPDGSITASPMNSLLD